MDENLGISSDVWAFTNPLQEYPKTTLLNSLKEPRMQHSCGVLKKDGNFIAVVAGGYNGLHSLDSVEILNFNERGKTLFKASKLFLLSLPQHFRLKYTYMYFSKK